MTARVPLYPDASELTAEARARLAALADHTELGPVSRSRCATSRSAAPATSLAPEQSGHVAALGFELYVEMLNEAVAELTGQARVAVRRNSVDARVDAYVPATYIEAEALKIDLHRRIALAEHDDELRELRAATEDAGPLPEPVEALFRIQEAKLALALVGADYLVYRGGRATVGPVGLAAAEECGRCASQTAVYTSARQEVAIHTDGLEGALALADAIVALAGPPEHANRPRPRPEPIPNTA